MANTEVLNALKQVRTARKAVGELQLQLQGQLTPEESNALNNVYSDLEDLEDLLVLEDIKDSIVQIKSDANDLKAIADQMKQVSQRLSAISDTIATVAKVVGTLADILAKATSSGLL
jgi:hypothetical protein